MDRFKLIGKQIKEAREQNKMTQSQLGRILGYTSVAVTNYEKGKRKISIDDLEKIAKVLGKPLTFFLGEDITRAEPPVNILNNIKENLQNALDLTYLPVVESFKEDIPWLSKENITDYVAFPKKLVQAEAIIVKAPDNNIKDIGIDKGDYLVINTNLKPDEGAVLIRKNNKTRLGMAENIGYDDDSDIIGKVIISFRRYE